MLYFYFQETISKADMAAADVFRFLKPYCVEIAKNPNLKSINELQNALYKTEKAAFNEQSMLEYLLFPLKLTIQRTDPKNEKLLIKTLSCVCFIFKSSKIKNEQLFMDFFDTCCLLLSSRNQSTGKDMLATISEELKSVIVTLLMTLVDNADDKVIISLFSKAMLPRLGHAVSLLLALSEFEKDRDLRVSSLECLCLLAFLQKPVSESQKQHISDVYCSFLPGISLAASRILSDNSNFGQKVITAVVETWRTFLCLVMEDCRFEFLERDKIEEDLAEKIKDMQSKIRPMNLAKSSEKVKSKEEPAKRELGIQRDRAWMEATSSKLKLLIDKVASRISNHSNVKVRLAAVSFAKSIITVCGRSMLICLPKLVEMLAGMQQDEFHDVCKASLDAIEAARKSFGMSGNSFIVTIEDKLYERLLSLPRVMRSMNDDQKLISLNIVLGYFNLMGKQLSKVFNSITMLEKIMKSFIQAVELDVTDVKIVEEKSSLPSEIIINEDHSEKPSYSNIEENRFKNFKDGNILQAIKKICHAIGRFADLEIVVDYLLEIFLSSSAHRKEAVLILNEILLSRVEDMEQTQGYREASKLNQLISQVISTFLRDEFWYLPTANVTDVRGTQREFLEDRLSLMRIESRANELEYWEKGISIEQINSNIQLTCLMINGIAICSGVMRRDFSVNLINVLYPLLEKHGNENALIAKSAHNALRSISSNCGEASVAGLITNNADYLINAISMSFRNLTLLSSAPCVLSVMLTYSNADILPLVTDVIQDVFNCLDMYQDEVAFSMMSVLKSLSFTVKTWFADGQKDAQKEERPAQVHEKEANHVSPIKLRDFLSNYCKTKQDALGDFKEEELEEEGSQGERIGDINESEESNVDEKKKIPGHFQAVLTALEKCQHFLPSKDLRLKLLVLDVIESGVQAVRQRQNDLLPAIHKIWPSLIERLRDSQQNITSRTLEVICIMISCSGDFMRQRVRKDVLRFATEFLEKQHKTSLKSGPMYRFCQSCKLQLKVIDLIGNMVPNLEFSGDDLGKSAVACSWYLDCRQPPLLQEAAVKALKQIMEVDWDYMWLILTSLYSATELKAPTRNFKDIELPQRTHTRNEYTDNVMRILYDEKSAMR